MMVRRRSFNWMPYKCVNDWMDDKKIKPGCTKHNLTYLREYKELRDMSCELMCYLYFLSVHLNNKYSRSMLGSFIKQKRFLNSVIHDLKERQVTSEYVPAFERDVKMLRERIDRIKSLAFDNLRLTPYWIFFSNLSPEDLYERVCVINKDDRMESEEALAKEAEEYVTTHPEEAAAHMESVKDEIEKLEAHQAKVAAKIQAEKEAEARAKADKKALEKERQKNLDEYWKRERKIRKEINTQIDRIHNYG